MDEFTIVRTLRGAIYGKVALVRHLSTERHYAIKMMSLAHMAAQRAVSGPLVSENGNSELRILRRISGNLVVGGGDGMEDRSRSIHPLWEAWGQEEDAAMDVNVENGPLLHHLHHHLLVLHADFVDERTHARCLVFDYCPYGELYDQLQRTPTRMLGIETARVYFRQIATAVRHIHALNIAHRDVSLENVLVDAHRQCRLGDFGLACEYGTMCSGRVGKAFYMAPEVYDWQPGELYDGLKADVWSLGIVLFVMVTGAPPFEAPNEIDARFRVVKAKGIGALISMWKLDVKLPFELCDLLAVLLAMDAEERVDIEALWTHPWMQEPIDAQALAAEGDFKEKMVDVQLNTEDSMEDHVSGGDGGEVDEPQEEVEAEAVSHASMMKRRRKRIKIEIEDAVDDQGMTTPIDRVAGFCAAGYPSEIGVALHFAPPELCHESPSGDGGGDAFPRTRQPRASPVMWPKVGVKAALRRLFLRPATAVCMDDTEATENEEEKHDVETIDSMASSATLSRCRPRLDSSSSCSSCSSSSSASASLNHPALGSLFSDKDHHQKTTVTKHGSTSSGAVLCRFCLRWVASDKCRHRITLPSTSSPEQRSKTRRVCDACFVTISTSLAEDAWRRGASAAAAAAAPQVA